MRPLCLYETSERGDDGVILPLSRRLTEDWGVSPDWGEGDQPTVDDSWVDEIEWSEEE